MRGQTSMLRVLRSLFVCALFAFSAFAQTADQEVVSAVDSPDPVVPGNNVTYTVTMKNNGPDPAVNGGLNITLSGSVTPVSATPPAGFSCTAPSQFMTCNTPSMAVGTYVFTVVVNVPSSLLNFADGSFSSTFSTSGTTTDPNNGNNSKNATTNYDSPQINMGIAVTDSPDPVTPNNDITYTVNISNAGPDGGTNATFNVFNNGSLRYQSITIPAGWSCPSLPSTGGAPQFTCTKPAYANGETAQFLVVVRADPTILGLNDGTVSTFFGINATGNETNNNDNGETENTAYVTPDADLGVTASDSPDPVTPGNNITYTGNVTNAGPDAAMSTTLNIPLALALRFQSITGPAGFSCTTPTVGTNGPITCTNASFASGSNVPFTLVVQVDPALLNGPDGTISQNFVISSNNVTDPNNPNNTATVVTTYQTPKANLVATNADTPDPVNPGGTITYTQTITNNGPDSATSVSFSQTLPAGVTFQTLTSPGGWSCTTPVVGGTGSTNCTIASLANGANGSFTLVVNVTASSGTISDTVTASSSTFDPTPGNNNAQAVTTIVAAASADLTITKTTTTTFAPAGSQFAYTITLHNNGPDAASSVVMTDTLPSSLLFRSITQPAGFTCTTPAVGATGTITCNAATLANNATATFTLTVEVAPGATGTIMNSAGVLSATSDPNSGNSGASAGAVMSGAAVADVVITKTTATTSASTGSQFAYTITVTNNGPSPATGVVVTDALPAGLQFVSAVPSQGACNASSPVTCNLGTIGVTASATITLTVQVTGTSGTIANTASVSATEDPTGGTSTAPAVTITAGQAAGAPTLSEWALVLLGAMLAAVAVMRMR
ncbi:MAG: hypothetical protein DMF56_00875 [Acidobacteria bacterium]|nr:MAG: hypothetical protein DMF56_00875 [Acidobacteriota bacterium]